jgi:hypothetical protein
MSLENNLSEIILGYFGFDRTLYGNATKKNKKWWQRLNEENLSLISPQ